MEGTVVTLRPLEEGDLPLLRQWNFDPEITRYFPSRWPVSEWEQKKWFDREVNATDKKRLVIIDRNKAKPIGVMAVLNVDHINKNCEVGITIGDREYWGKPHAGEAMQLMLNFLFAQLNMHLVYLRVMQDNERAGAFFRKCGFIQNGVLRDMVFTNGMYHNWIWMSMTQAEYATNHALKAGPPH